MSLDFLPLFHGIPGRNKGSGSRGQISFFWTSGCWSQPVANKFHSSLMEEPIEWVFSALGIAMQITALGIWV